MGKKKKAEKKQGKVAKRTYQGARHNNLTADWLSPSTSEDSEIASSLSSLRDRARQLARDTPQGKSILKTLSTNIVGTGVRLQSEVKMRSRDERDGKINAAIEELWDVCKEARYFHTGGTLSFQDMESLIPKYGVHSGEIFFRIVRQSFDGSPVPFALEVIEPDQLDETLNGAYGSNQVKMGIEVNDWGRPVAYHFHPYHPGDYQFARKKYQKTYERILREDIIHPYVSDRLQLRGVPWFHAAMENMRNLAGYTHSEVTAARVQSNVSGFIETPDPESWEEGLDEQGQPIKYLKPGLIQQLAPGEKFTGFAPNRPNEGFEAFVRAMDRQNATSFGVSYESWSGDFTNTSYSSARTSLMAERGFYRVAQAWMVQNFHQRVFEAWLEMAVMCGALNLPNYDLNPRFYNRPKWICRGWEWVDPVDEVKSAKEAIKGGLNSLTNIVAQQTGRDVEDVIREKAREQELAKKYGVSLDIYEQGDLLLPSDGRSIEAEFRREIRDRERKQMTRR